MQKKTKPKQKGYKFTEAGTTGTNSKGTAKKGMWSKATGGRMS